MSLSIITQCRLLGNAIKQSRIKIPLLGSIIGVTIIATGALASGYIPNAPGPMGEEPPVDPETGYVVPGENPKEEGKTEDKNEEQEDQKEENVPAGTENKPSSTQPTSKPASSSSKPTQSRPTDKYLSDPQPAVQDTPSGRHYDTLWYYAQDYFGVCPKDRPKWNDGLNHPMISVGVWSDGLTLNGQLEQYWDEVMDKGTFLGDVYMMASLSNIKDFVRSCDNDKVGLELTWSTKTIRWVDLTGGRSSGQNRNNKSAERLAELDGIANRATNYLRWLDNTYKSRCPNG